MKSNSSIGRRITRVLLLGLCALVFVLQASQLVDRFLPVAKQIRVDIGKSSAWRGLNFAFGKAAADYLQFVNNNVSLDASILLGSLNGPEYLARPVDMQIFLYPRHIYNCTGGAYQDCLPNTPRQAALITDKQTIALVNDQEGFQAYNEDLGLLFTGNAPDLPQANWQDFSSVAEFALSFLPPLLMILALVVPAIMLVALSLPGLNAPLHIGVGTAIGIGVHSLLLFLGLMLVGGEGRLTKDLVVVCVAIPWCLLLPFLRALYRFNWRAWLNFSAWWLLYMLPVCLGSVALFLAVGTGYSYVDEYLLWSAKAYGILSEGLSAGLSGWGTFGTRYPLNIFLNIAGFATLFGDQLPESKIIFPVFYMALLLVAGGWLQKALGNKWAFIGVSILASSPLLFFHATLGYANLAFALYLLAALVIGLQPVKHSPYLAGLLLLFAAWTRAEGVAIAAVIAVLLAAYHWRLDRRLKPGRLLAVITPLVVYSIAWAFLAPRIYADGGLAEGLFTQHLGDVLRGHINWPELGFTLRWLLTYLFSLHPTAWGGLGIFLVIFVFGLLYSMRRPAAEDMVMILGGVSVLALVAGGYFMTSYSLDGPDTSWWILTGMDRMIMPAVLMLWLVAYSGCIRIFDDARG